MMMKLISQMVGLRQIEINYQEVITMRYLMVRDGLGHHAEILLFVVGELWSADCWMHRGKSGCTIGKDRRYIDLCEI